VAFEFALTFEMQRSVTGMYLNYSPSRAEIQVQEFVRLRTQQNHD